MWHCTIGMIFKGMCEKFDWNITSANYVRRFNLVFMICGNLIRKQIEVIHWTHRWNCRKTECCAQHTFQRQSNMLLGKQCVRYSMKNTHMDEEKREKCQATWTLLRPKWPSNESLYVKWHWIYIQIFFVGILLNI